MTKTRSLNKEKIVENARCTRDEHGIYCVTSPELDILLGAAETEGRAWQIFFELLDEYWGAYNEDNLIGYRREAAKMLGRLGGKSTSRTKQVSSAQNGKKGGRPPKNKSA